jgi:hypothetical protein
MLNAREREKMIDELMREHQFGNGDIYLLELIPLIEMIWADGHNQQAEVDLLYTYAVKHIANLTELTDGEPPVSIDEVNQFIQRFMEKRPDPHLLKDLRHYATKLCFNTHDAKLNHQGKQELLHYCMDIAAASVTCYPYDQHQRVMDNEKTLLLELIDELHLLPHS